ncbi:nucleosome assembly protein 1-like 1 [Centruroides vittatus]|uniref:nucleosome assembly protein 1-like 1 n=1 Tax=Centruroides vittatus TaxID=120091 RepID=UPI00350F2E76
MSEKNSTCADDISTVSMEVKPGAIAAEAPDKKVKDNSVDDDYLPYVLSDVAPDVKNRILELRNLQLRYFNSKVNYYKELHQLEMKYADIYKPLFETRFEIVNGIRKSSLAIKKEMEEEKLYGESNKNKGDERQEILGIPDFWLIVFLNSSVLSSMINMQDELVLKHLKDVIVKYVSDNRMDFVLEFHFEPNEYFSNSVLTKEYCMKCEVDPEDPFDFAGPEIVKCEGCDIDWKEGKNITLSAVKKNDRKKTKTVCKYSFFNFFNSLKQEEKSEERSKMLEDDLEIGQYIKEKIIPEALVYYTREVEESRDSNEDSTFSTESS